MGVWIETGREGGYAGPLESHPAWVCGLKQAQRCLPVIVHMVTPCVGVWIETGFCLGKQDLAVSHPAWVCGLKLMGKTK